MSIRVPIVSTFDDAGFRDADRALKRLEQAGGAAGAWAGATAKANKAVPALNRALVGVAAAGAYAAKAASDEEQARGALVSVYGDQSAAMLANAEAASKIGLSTADYAQQAAVLGSQLRNLGVAESEIGTQSDALITTGADLAAQFGGSTADAVAALGSLMRGERDPIEAYGVSIKQADIDARLAAEGLTGLTGEAAKAAETQATLALLTEQTAAAEGAFARESETAAGSTAIMRAELDNAAAAVGQALLPAAADLAGKLAGLAGWISQNTGLVYGLVGALVAARAAIAINNAVMAVYINRAKLMTVVTKVATAATKGFALATRAMAAAQLVLNNAVRANPIGALVTVLILVATALYTAYKKSDSFRAIVDRVWSAVKSLATTVGTALVNAFQWVTDKISNAITAVRSLLEWLGDLIDKARNAIDWINPFNATRDMSVAASYSTSSTIGYGAGPVLRAPARATRSAGITVNVSGALDPVAVARQIRSLLAAEDRRTGVAPLVRVAR